MTGAEHLATAVTTINDLASTTQEHHAALAQIRGDHELADDYRREQLRSAEQRFTEQHVAARGSAMKALEAAEQAASTYLTQPGDEATENRKARAASRVMRLIDGGTPILVAAEMFAEQRDVDALRALRDEVPSWVTQQLPALAQNSRRAQIEDKILAVDRLMAPLLTGEAAVAAEVRVKVADQRARLQAVSEHALSNTPTSRLKFAYSA